MKITKEYLDALTDEEFEYLEKQVERLTAVWKIQNLRGQSVIFHDDQHIGERRRELMAVHHPSFDVEGEMQFRAKPVVDNLAGNSLIHTLTTPIIEVDEDAVKARGQWWSIGIEALSKYQETPMAIVSLGIRPDVYVAEDGEWKLLSGPWQRTTKNEYHAGWVEDMQKTNTRPPLTEEEDRARLGKYAYQKDEVRQPVPEPPRKDTWEQFPDETDTRWMYLNQEPCRINEKTA